MLAAFAIALALAYIGLCASQFTAYLLGHEVGLRVGESKNDSLKKLRRLQWASRLDPGNADYPNYLGGYYNLSAHDPRTAVVYYQTAVRLNPRSAAYWFDLADVYQVLEDTLSQTAALEHAIHADPTKPDVAWEAANLYQVQGDNEKALREFRVVLANDPAPPHQAIQFCWRIKPDVDALLRDVVPPRNLAYVDFLSFLETKEETAGTTKVWNALLQTHQPFERRHADDYFNYLVLHKQVDQAVQVWQQTVDRFGLSRYLATPANLIVNGSFTLTPLNAGLDWHYQKQDRVILEFDPKDCPDDPQDPRKPCNGRRALTINFDGPGISEALIHQLVWVQPNTTYNFSAYYKTSEQQGAGGPHFTLQDAYDSTIYYDSDELRDAGFWKKAQGEFTTGPECKLLALHIRRLPAGHPIRVKLWIGDFRLTQKPS